MKAILIIDLGSQFTQLIARKIRERGAYSVVKSENFCPSEQLKTEDDTDIEIAGVVLSGGPASVYDEDAFKISSKVFDMGVPILGICYGQQLTVKHFGGEIIASDKREYGKADISITKPSDLLAQDGVVWMSHGDSVVSLPDGFEIIAKTNNTEIAAIANFKKNIYGVQFHPEVTHTEHSNEIFDNFVKKICKLESSWSMRSYMEHATELLGKKILKDETAICALSGGVDSMVAAELAYRACGESIQCIFINNGLLRHNEAEEVREFVKHKLHYVDASEEFYEALSGLSEPEEKRKAIGGKFIEIFERESKKFKNVKYLIQGTIYPDVIESSSSSDTKNAKTIKSHHNVGGLPSTLNFGLVEPLRMLFKDEVRNLGKELGMPDERIWRHPFPGPGLAIRILGEVTSEKISILQKADYIYISELKKRGLYDDIWQAFCVLLPCKTVGVMGDCRTYSYVLALRAVKSINGMTATFYEFNMSDLSEISSKIVNEVSGINRVVYDITSKPPATIEWE